MAVVGDRRRAVEHDGAVDVLQRTVELEGVAPPVDILRLAHRNVVAAARKARRSAAHVRVRVAPDIVHAVDHDIETVARIVLGPADVVLPDTVSGILHLGRRIERPAIVILHALDPLHRDGALVEIHQHMIDAVARTGGIGCFDQTALFRDTEGAFVAGLVAVDEAERSGEFRIDLKAAVTQIAHLLRLCGIVRELGAFARHVEADRSVDGGIARNGKPMRLVGREFLSTTQTGAHRPVEVTRCVGLDARITGNLVELAVKHLQRGLLTVVVGQVTAHLMLLRVHEDHGVDRGSDFGNLPFEIEIRIGLFDQIDLVAIRRIEQPLHRAEARIVIFRLLGTGPEGNTREQQSSPFIDDRFHNSAFDRVRGSAPETGAGPVRFILHKLPCDRRSFACGPCAPRS